MRIFVLYSIQTRFQLYRSGAVSHLVEDAVISISAAAVGTIIIVVVADITIIIIAARTDFTFLATFGVIIFLIFHTFLVIINIHDMLIRSCA